MAIVKISPIKIEGRWKGGVALDLHTTSSTPIGYDEYGHMRFETVRPEIAELLYRLKNRADRDAAGSIIETAVDFLLEHRHKFNAIVPVPPSQQRAIQPVTILAEGIAKGLNIPMYPCISTTRSTSQLKNVIDPEERRKKVEGLYQVDDARKIQGRSILLIDDLFRSGTTLNAITDILINQGKVSDVRVLTITKTRSNQ